MGCAAGQGVVLYASRRRLRAWRRGRRRGAQLVWEFAFYASRRQLRAWPGGGDGQGRGWTGIRFARLSPPTSGLARRGDGGALSWTGSLLSTPPAATSGLARRRQRRGARLDRELLCTPLTDFGPGPEAAAEGRSAGLGVCFLRLSPPTSGQARRRRQDGEFAFYASRRRLRAWLGGGCGGARSWRYFFLRLAPPTLGLARGWAAEGRAAGRGVCRLRLSLSTSGLARMGRRRGVLPGPGVCFSILHSPASRCEAQLCSVTGPNTI